MCDELRPPLSTEVEVGLEDAGAREALKRIDSLAREAHRRLGDPSARPPAWLFFLNEAYKQFPPPGLAAPQLAKARLSLRTAEKSRIGRTVLRVLMDAIRAYHPDKNRAEEHGPLWARIAEELTEAVTTLYSEYRTRIARPAPCHSSHPAKYPAPLV